MSDAMSYRYERYDERPRRRGWLALLVILVWVILGCLVLARFVVRPLVTSFIEERIAQRIESPEEEPAGDGRPDGQQPGGVAVLPEENAPGSFTISDADANQWLDEHRAELQGIDDVRMRFTPGRVQADVTVGGITSTAHAGVQVVDGRIAVVDPALDPPLGYVLDVTPFAELIEQRLNADLASTGRAITGVTIEQGRMTIAFQ